MTLNFGAGGAGEGIIYNSGTAIIQAQINAAQGLTKFGAGQLQIHSINPGIGGAVVIHEGTLMFGCLILLTGSPVGQVFNGQDIIVNGGTLNLQSYNANAAGTASEIASMSQALSLAQQQHLHPGRFNFEATMVTPSMSVQDLTVGKLGWIDGDEWQWRH